MRSLHKWLGLPAAALLVVLALSGAFLSFMPTIDVVRAPAQLEPGLDVAELAGRIAASYPGVEQIRRAPSGKITAFVYEGDRPSAVVIDPASGTGVGAAEASSLERFVTNLHRALLLGDAGRIATAAGAAAMLALSISGLSLIARRMGGWRNFLAPLKGSVAGRLHAGIARFATAGLLLSSATALWMSASTFELVPNGPGAPPFPAAVSGGTGFALADMPLLRDTPVEALRELTFPDPGDPTDVFTLKTDAGQGFVDQGTGTLLAWSDLGTWDRITETVYTLHTGQGAPLLGLILGFSAMGVPAMAGSGFVLWYARRGRPRMKDNARPGQAETVILVGSEGGSTWDFAATLHAALTASGQKAHVAPMSAFSPASYDRALRIIVLTATYGNGAAPASARGFLERLASRQAPPDVPLAVLGFGDRGFPSFCGFAKEVAGMAEAKNWSQLLPLDTVDRRSPQDFARWGAALGRAMGIELVLNHQPAEPRSHPLVLLSRRDYGEMVQAPTAILRFALPRATLWQRLLGGALPSFEPGDLLGIVPEGTRLPRFYSLASGTRDGFAEICVRKHPGGLCSGQLMELRPGERIRAFISRNPGFRLTPGRAPVVLIGAGTGIGPLAGFARSNRPGRPMHLYFGVRHPDSDLLYGDELVRWQAEGRLSSVSTAFSRTSARAYVQDALRRDGARVARLVSEGAQVMVCGGREMAAGVAETLADILAPTGLSLARLKTEGRYAEDVY